MTAKPNNGIINNALSSNCSAWRQLSQRKLASCQLAAAAVIWRRRQPVMLSVNVIAISKPSSQALAKKIISVAAGRNNRRSRK